MQEIKTTKNLTLYDLSSVSLIETMVKLWSKDVARPINTTRFLLLIDEACIVADLLASKELQNFNIEYCILPDGVLAKNSYIVTCPDTGAVYGCPGNL